MSPLSYSTLQNALDYDQYGNVETPWSLAFTGTQRNGLAYSEWYMGDDVLLAGQPMAIVGSISQGVEGWLDCDELVPTSTALPFYALSSPIIVSAPEPSTFALLAVALASLGGFRLLRRKKTRERHEEPLGGDGALAGHLAFLNTFGEFEIP